MSEEELKNKKIAEAVVSAINNNNPKKEDKLKYLPALSMVVIIISFFIYNRYEIERNSEHRKDKDIHRSYAEAKQIANENIDSIKDGFTELSINQKVMSKQLEAIESELIDMKKKLTSN